MESQNQINAQLTERYSLLSQVSAVPVMQLEIER